MWNFQVIDMFCLPVQKVNRIIPNLRNFIKQIFLRITTNNDLYWARSTYIIYILHFKISFNDVQIFPKKKLDTINSHGSCTNVTNYTQTLMMTERFDLKNL